MGCNPAKTGLTLGRDLTGIWSNTTNRWPGESATNHTPVTRCSELGPTDRRGTEDRMNSTEPTILIVEDNARLAEKYAEMLAEHDVRVATTGREAFRALDDAADIVVLDRGLPDVSGDDVLDEINRRHPDCGVVIVTATDPDFDILDMGFDDYLIKPVTEAELGRSVDLIFKRTSYEARLQDLFALSTKLSLLEGSKGRSELERTDEYRQLREEHRAIKDRLDRTIASFETTSSAPFTTSSTTPSSAPG